MRLTKLKKFGAIITSAYFLVLFTVAFTLPILSASAADYVPLAPIPGLAPNVNCGASLNPGSTVAENTAYQSACGTNLSSYLTGMFKIGIAVAGVLAFLMIVWGGFEYLSTDAISGKEEGKERITRALGGLILALTSFIILNTINPKLVSLNLNFGGDVKVESRDAFDIRQIMDQQKALMEKSVAEQDISRAAKVNSLKAQAKALRAQANVLPGTDSDPNKAALLAEAYRLERLAEETDLQRVAALKSEQSTVNLTNAYTQTQLTDALTQAGTNVQQIQAAYARARTELASDPARVAALSFEELERLSSLQKTAARAIINNPPLNNPNDSRASVSVDGTDTGPVASAYVNQALLNAEIQKQLNLIEYEKVRQINLLEKMKPGTAAADSNITLAGIRVLQEKVINGATAQICDIKNNCRDNDLSCANLSPGVVCK